MNVKLSRLGFGLSGIAGSGNYAHQERLVKTAIDAGITHFDVAPFYGSGDAEKILGKILSNCSEPVTITTKFGLLPFSGGRAGTMLRSILRPVFRQMKSLKALASAVVSHTHEQVKSEYIEGSLLASVQRSISNLRHPIDVLLLHDAGYEFAQNISILQEMDELRATGLASLTGVSGESLIVKEIYYTHPKTYAVVQFENSLSHQAPIDLLTESKAYIITHRAIQGGIKKLKFLIESRPGFKNVWLKEIDIDPEIPENLAHVLIELALAENPNGTVLFSSTNPNRIKKIAETIHSPILKAANTLKVRRLLNEIS